MLNITGQKITLTESVKSLIQTKYQKIESRYSANLAEFQFSQENKSFRTHLEVTTHHYGKFSAESFNTDFKKSVNETFHKIERQINSAKNKWKSKGGERINHLLLEENEEDDMQNNELESVTVNSTELV